MEYAKLGHSGIEVSRFCLGCMSFGDPESKMHAWTLNPEESEKIIKHALDLGINFFDTANCYSAGTSEEYLDDAVGAFGVKLSREDIAYIDEAYVPHKIVGAL